MNLTSWKRLAKKLFLRASAPGKVIPPAGPRAAEPTPPQSTVPPDPAVVEVCDEGHCYRFHATTQLERWRAETLLVKEAGTISWIRQSVQPGEVFYDVGANIGLYSVVAAKHVGPAGAVYAFEPHAGNFFSLIRNISLNELTGIVRPLAVALHHQEGLFPFNYIDCTVASSGSQLDSCREGNELEFSPVVTELKWSLSLDAIMRQVSVRPPDHIKIDVDGNELLILQGMEQLLRGPHRPKTIQVEVNARYKAGLFAFLAACGYEQYARHDTMHGQSKIDQGHDPETIAHNALFRPTLTRRS